MERRQNKRIIVNLPVNYSVNQKARAINLSMCGLKLETGKLLIKGTILFLDIHLPGEELKVIGEVRWSRAVKEGKFENGVEFFFMDSTYKNKIREYIETRDEKPLNITMKQNQ